MDHHFTFTSRRAQLVATLHLPDEGQPKALGLVLLHGWAGYKIGAHRMFVKLGREAAVRGHACLRFDFRGRGDSEGGAAKTNLTTMIEDAVAAARTLLQQQPGVTQIALIGDCSGSEVAIGAGVLVPECKALALWSAPIVGASRQASDKAKRKHILAQYAGKLFRRETWGKLLAGGLQPAMIKKAISGGGKGAGEQGAEIDKKITWLERFATFPGQVLFVYGSKDPTTDEAVGHYEPLTAESGRDWHLHTVDGANHAFYSATWEREVIEATLDWLATSA